MMVKEIRAYCKDNEVFETMLAAKAFVGGRQAAGDYVQGIVELPKWKAERRNGPGWHDEDVRVFSVNYAAKDCASRKCRHYEVS